MTHPANAGYLTALIFPQRYLNPIYNQCQTYKRDRGDGKVSNIQAMGKAVPVWNLWILLAGGH